MEVNKFANFWSVAFFTSQSARHIQHTLECRNTIKCWVDWRDSQNAYKLLCAPSLNVSVRQQTSPHLVRASSECDLTQEFIPRTFFFSPLLTPRIWSMHHVTSVCRQLKWLIPRYSLKLSWVKLSLCSLGSKRCFSYPPPWYFSWSLVCHRAVCSSSKKLFSGSSAPSLSLHRVCLTASLQCTCDWCVNSAVDSLNSGAAFRENQSKQKWFILPLSARVELTVNISQLTYFVFEPLEPKPRPRQVDTNQLAYLIRSRWPNSHRNVL